MAPTYKLTYFDVHGLAEQIRFILSYGGLDFEDVRVAREDWPTLKSTIAPPLGQLPLLEVDGKALFQSGAIMKYLADVVGLAGSTPLENWEINAVYDSFTDFRLKVLGYFFEPAGDKKDTLLTALLEEHIPFYLTKLEEWAGKNGGKHLALGKLTWVDLTFASLVEVFDDFLGEQLKKPILTGFPNLQAVQNEVFNTPGIKEWIAKRPPKPTKTS